MGLTFTKVGIRDIIIYISQKDEPMNIIQFDTDDILVLKKKHPCGSDSFKVQRRGSDVRILCTGCGRDLTIPREKLEKMIKKVEKTT